MTELTKYFVYRCENMPPGYGYIITLQPLRDTNDRRRMAPQIWNGDAIDHDDALRLAQSKEQTIEKRKARVYADDEDDDEE